MREKDIDYLAYNLRQSDINEVWASHHYTPYKAIKESFNRSSVSMTIDRDNPIGCFGINPPQLLGDSAVIWFLATNELDSIGVRFLRNSRKFIDYFLTMYPKLENYVDARNDKTLEWLWFLGADISSAKPYGIEGRNFHHFEFTR